MIFTTTRELLLDYTSTSLLCDKRPPSYAVDLVNVSIPRVLSMWRKDVVWRETHNESMVNSSSHSEGFVLVEEWIRMCPFSSPMATLRLFLTVRISIGTPISM